MLSGADGSWSTCEAAGFPIPSIELCGDFLGQMQSLQSLSPPCSLVWDLLHIQRREDSISEVFDVGTLSIVLPLLPMPLAMLHILFPAWVKSIIHVWKACMCAAV